MASRLRRVRSPSPSAWALAPAMVMLPASGRSSRPVMWSRVDLPAPLGPTSPTISRGSIARSMPRRIASRLPPCSKLRCIPLSTSTGSLIAKRLDRIQPGGAPGGIDRRQEGERQGHGDHGEDIAPVEDRRQPRAGLDLGRKQSGPGQTLQQLADGLDVAGKRHAERQAGDGADDADGAAAHDVHPQIADAVGSLVAQQVDDLALYLPN